MMRMSLMTLSVVVGMGLAVTPMRAHHAFTAEFDSNQPVSFRGTITKMDWVNPHSWIHIDVKDETGRVTNWALELGAPNALFRRGWRKDSIAVGTEVAVTGFACKSGQPCANGRTITLPDGRELFVGSEGTGAPVDGADRSGKR
jgi:hypothetical protein